MNKWENNPISCKLYLSGPFEDGPASFTFTGETVAKAKDVNKKIKIQCRELSPVPCGSGTYCLVRGPFLHRLLQVPK